MGNDKHIFVSYSRQDGDFALKIGQDLRAANVDIWLDQLDISPGSRWDREVDNALRTCGRLLLILSPDSASSENVMDEVAVAMHENKPVVPVLYRPCSIPLRLMRLQHIDFTQSYEEGLNKLLDYLGGLGQDGLARAREPKVKIPRSQFDKTFIKEKLSLIKEKLSFHPFTLSKKTANSWQLLVICAAGMLAFTLIVFILIKIFDSHPTNTSQPTASQSPVALKDSLGISIPSTDRDKPTQLTSNEVRGTGVYEEKVRYFYSFIGGPGEIKVTFDFTAGGWNQAGHANVFDEDAKKLAGISIVGNSGDYKREVSRIQLKEQKKLIVEIALSSNEFGKEGSYLLRVEGDVHFGSVKKN